MENYSQEEFNKKLNMQIRRLTENMQTNSLIPKAILIVGQPGAGKTTIARIINEQMNYNTIFISGDEYRKAHPHYYALYEKYGDAAVLKTQKFAGEMTEALINYLSKKNYNLIIEGTLRTLNVPIHTKTILENRGYHVELSVMLVRPEQSYLSILKRYQEMKESGTTPRMTPKEHHDLVVHNIINNLDTIYKRKLFSSITMYNRDKIQIYNSQEMPTINPAILMKKEFSRNLTKKERTILLSDFKKYVTSNELQKIVDHGLTILGKEPSSSKFTRDR